MSLVILIGIGIIISVVFHFIGVYADAKKSVWVAIILMWAGGISIATHEVKPQAYEDIKKMQGKYPDTDKLIKQALPKVSLYELITIKRSYLSHQNEK